MPDPIFRCCILHRLGLPLDPSGGICEGCNTDLDVYGYHRETCSRTSRLHDRHKAMIDVWKQVLREAGARIRTTGRNRNIERYLRNTHLDVAGTDGRRMDIVVGGLEGVYGGAPLFLDVTVMCSI